MWSILYLLRNNPEKLRWSQKRRGLDESIIDKALKYDTAWRKSLKQLNDLRHKHNLISREIPKLKGVEREEKIKEAKRIEKEISTLEEEVKRLEMEREKLLRSIPNVVHEDVPIGESDLDNVPIRFYGKHRVWKGHLDAFLKQTEGFKVDYEVIDWKPVGHADALEMLGLGDTLRAAKVAGSRFYYLFEDLVWLDLALLLYALDHMAKLGFKPCIPPYMLRRTPYEGVITLGDFEDAIYKIEGEDLYLIATSEHPMAALYMGEAIEEDQLPILLTGISPCFRKEAGTRGKDTKGIFRVHQFHKVEQFVFCMPEESWKWHEKLIKNAEIFLKKD